MSDERPNICELCGTVDCETHEEPHNALCCPYCFNDCGHYPGCPEAGSKSVYCATKTGG